MKLLSTLIILSIFGVIYVSSECGCKDSCRQKIKVKEDKDPEIKVILTGSPCACQKALPFRVEKPVIPKEKLHKHKYNVEIKEEKSVPDCRYVYNTKVEKPVVEKVELSKYPVRVEKLLEECKNDPRFIYSVKIEKPEEKCGTQLEGLIAKVDKIVMPREDCLQPCCHSSRSSEEIPKNKIKKSSRKHVYVPKSSEESSEEIESSEEHYIKKHKIVSPKTRGCPKCEAIISAETGCGCSTKHSEEEEILSSEESDEYISHEASSTNCGSFEEIHKYSSEASSEEYCHKCNLKKHQSDESNYASSEEIAGGCQCDESSEEIHIQSSEEQCKKSRKPKCESSEEIHIQSSEEQCTKCRKPKYESSEEIQVESSEELCKKTPKNKYESSEEIQVESSEESCKKAPPKKCESSEEHLVESSEEVKTCGCNAPDDSEEIYEEEHWTKGRPIRIFRKPQHRYSTPNIEKCCKRFSRYKRELFLDDMQDFSVITEPLTRNEIQKVVAKILANSTLSTNNKRKRKGKKRQRNRHLVQNKDQFDEHNKLKQIFEAKPIYPVEEKINNEQYKEDLQNNPIFEAEPIKEENKNVRDDEALIVKFEQKFEDQLENKLKQIFEDPIKDVQDDEAVIVNGKPDLVKVLENNPKDLEQKLEDEILFSQNEERNKRHSKCKTIEQLKKKPRYNMDVLADAGCSQYIPEIITDEFEDQSCEEYYDYIFANRNKRHSSYFNGNTNYPTKIIDATPKHSTHSSKKIQYRRHHHPKHTTKHENLQATRPKFYYKYLSLTAPDLSSNQFMPHASKNEDLQQDKKIVYDHLGHKFLEYNGFRTLIKPKIEYYDDNNYEKPKFWTCKEDLIDPKDFGKTTTFFEIVSTTTEINLENETTTTTEVTENSTDLHKIEDLEEHELNLCEYLKNLELTQNLEVQQEAKNIFLHNCEDYIKFLIFNSSESESSNVTNEISTYLENLLHNSHIKIHLKKLFHTKQKFENKLINITKLLHKPKIIENFKNYLLFKNEYDSMKNKLNLKDYKIFDFYANIEFVLNNKFEKNSTTSTAIPDNLSTIISPNSRCGL